jgi:DNA repair ATPase RecN
MVIKNTLAYQQHLEQYNSLQYKSDSNTLMYITQLENIIKTYKNNYYKNETIKNNINTVQSQLNNMVIPDDITEQLDNVITNIANLDTILIKNVKAKEIIKIHEELTTQREELVTLTNKIDNLTNLKNYAIDIECKILQSVVDNINSCLFDICVSLFDDLKMELSLFKTLKGVKNITKPYVNFDINYKGGNFDNLTDVSGGESDRISLAVTLALNKLSPCKIIMFDEVTGGIGTELKNAVIKTVREHVNATVLFVQYEGIEGVFDHVIDVDQLTTN